MKVREVSLGCCVPLSTVRALLFDKMMELATPVVKYFRSDLYHDAIWLTVHITGNSFTFYYQVREDGTSIGETIGFMTDNRYPVHRFTFTATDKDRHPSYHVMIESPGEPN